MTLTWITAVSSLHSQHLEHCSGRLIFVEWINLGQADKISFFTYFFIQLQIHSAQLFTFTWSLVKGQLYVNQDMILFDWLCIFWQFPQHIALGIMVTQIKYLNFALPPHRISCVDDLSLLPTAFYSFLALFGWIITSWYHCPQSSPLLDGSSLNTSASYDT